MDNDSWTTINVLHENTRALMCFTLILYARKKTVAPLGCEESRFCVTVSESYVKTLTSGS